MKKKKSLSPTVVIFRGREPVTRSAKDRQSKKQGRLGDGNTPAKHPATGTQISAAEILNRQLRSVGGQGTTLQTPHNCILVWGQGGIACGEEVIQFFLTACFNPLVTVLHKIAECLQSTCRSASFT